MKLQFDKDGKLIVPREFRQRGVIVKERKTEFAKNEDIKEFYRCPLCEGRMVSWNKVWRCEGCKYVREIR